MAVQAVRAASELQRDPMADEQRRLNGIRAAIRDGATGLALTLIDQWLAAAPGRGDLHVLKGAAFEQEGRPGERQNRIPARGVNPAARRNSIFRRSPRAALVLEGDLRT